MKRTQVVLMALTIMWSSSACYSPKLKDCTVKCGPGSSCPASLTCRNGYCSGTLVCPPAQDDRHDASKDQTDDVGSDARNPTDLNDAAPDCCHDADARDVATDADKRDLARDAADAAGGGNIDAHLTDRNQTDVRVGDASDGRSTDARVDAPPDGSASGLPTDLDGLVLWLDPSLAVASPSFVWYDRGPSQTYAAAPPGHDPFILPPAARIPPLVQFAGGGQYLALPPGFEDFSQGLTAFVVARAHAPVIPDNYNALRFFDFATAAGGEVGGILFSRFGTSAEQLLYQVFDLDTMSSPGLVPGYYADGVVVDDLDVYEVAAAGGTPDQFVDFSYYRNGLLLGNGQALVPNIVERDSNFIAHSNNYGPDYIGSMGDIIIFNRQLLDAERKEIELFLMNRWALH